MPGTDHLKYKPQTKIPISMTRLGDLLDFGHLFQAFGNNCIAQITHILDIFCKGVKIIHLPCEIIFGQLLKTFGNYLLVTLLPT